MNPNNPQYQSAIDNRSNQPNANNQRAGRRGASDDRQGLG